MIVTLSGWSSHAGWAVGPLLVLALALLPIADAATVDARTPIASLRNLSQAELAARRPVRIRGVITQRLQHWFILQDESGGIRVDFRPASAQGIWTGPPDGPLEGRVGLGMEVDGIVVLGEIAPMVLPRAVRLLGPEPLPPAREADDDRLFHGADDSERVRVTGIVRLATQQHRSPARIVLDCRGRPFEALVADQALPAPADTLVDAVVAVVGPVVGFVNTRRELILPKMWVFEPENITVVTPRRSPPFETTLLPLKELATFRPRSFGGHMVRIRGGATYAVPGSLVYLQDEATGIRVETASEIPIRPGDVVEAAGFIDRPGDSFVYGLDDAVVRVIEPGPVPTPAPIGPDAIMRLNENARDGDMPAEPGDYDGTLVRFPARLVEAKSSPDGGTLVLEAENRLVHGLLAAVDMAALRGLEPGSTLLVTGIVRLTWAPDPSTGRQGRPTDFTLLVRNSGDVSVIQPAPFWTRQRLLMALAAAATTLAAALLWVWLLRRQVAAQVIVIKETLQQEAVAGERRRIAREFHDSLEQGLAGMAMRLDAASRRLTHGPIRDVLQQHRGLVGRLQTETRDFLRDLREPPGSETTLTAGLHAIVTAARPLTDAQIMLDLPDSHVTIAAEIQYDVLRIIREAVTNALRHAAATTVTVSMRVTEGLAQVIVTDDGTGFEVAARSAVPGHYGIRGMEERAERIGGALTVSSVPGQGARIELTVSAQAACSDSTDTRESET